MTILSRIFGKRRMFNQPGPITLGSGSIQNVNALHQVLLNEADRKYADLSKQKASQHQIDRRAGV